MTQKRMPAFQFALAAALALVLLFTGGLWFRSWRGTVVAQRATLVDVSGVVEVLPAGSDAWQLAAPGTHVTTGDHIRTGASSAVTLVFFDGSATNLAADTKLTMSQLSGRRDGRSKVIVLHQWMGRTYNRVQRLLDAASRFEIETPTAVTAVRGTAFTVEVAPDGATQVMVEKGLVEVTAQETTVGVQPGQATTVQPDSTPAPVVPALTPVPPATPQPSATPNPFQSPLTTSQPTATLEPTATEEPEGPAETPDGDDDNDGDDDDDANDGDDGHDTNDGNDANDDHDTNDGNDANDDHDTNDGQ